MTAWHTQRMCAFDVETTGVDVETARIVTAAIVILDGDTATQRLWLADPGVEIPAEAAKIHGVTTERAAAEGWPARDVIDEITYILAAHLGRGVPVVAMNARYDLTVLDRESRRNQLPTLRSLCGEVGPVIDPYVLDKQADKYRRGRRTLTALCEHYGVALGADAHSAGADAIAAARVARELAVRYPQLQVPLGELHRLQKLWAVQQAASLQAYLRRADPGAVVEGAWPLIPAGGAR